MVQFSTSAQTGTALDPLIFFLSGCFAGAAEGFVTYPFEFAKTSVQLRKADSSNNPLRVISQIIARQGPGALYTGCGPLVLGNMGKDGVRFFAYDAIKGQLAGSSGHLGLLQGIVAGVGAGTLESVLVVTPSERMKTAMIDDARSGRKVLQGLPDAVRSIIRSQGALGLYKGLLPTTMKQASTSAVRMGSYTYIRELAESYGVKHNTLTTFTTGAMAGTITVYATQPFDSIKTRSQALGSLGTLDAVRSIFLDYGVRGFWRGSTMRLGRLLLGGGIVFTAYEHSRSFLEALLITAN